MIYLRWSYYRKYKTGAFKKIRGSSSLSRTEAFMQAMTRAGDLISEGYEFVGGEDFCFRAA